jgi:hypothetical protein
LASLDGVMQQELARYSVKGGAIAVVKDGHLIFARGYGLADLEARPPYNGKLGDSRLPGITVRQVLHYVGCWDRMISGDSATALSSLNCDSVGLPTFPRGHHLEAKVPQLR